MFVKFRWLRNSDRGLMKLMAGKYNYYPPPPPPLTDTNKLFSTLNDGLIAKKLHFYFLFRINTLLPLKVIN